MAYRSIFKEDHRIATNRGIFQRPIPIPTQEPTAEDKPEINLHHILKAGYGSLQDQQDFASKNGLTLDKNSNDNHQIYFHEPSKSLYMNVTGTHNLADVKTDARLMLGGLEKTDRFKEAQKALDKAKADYQPANTSLTAHSLGASIITKLKGTGGDKVTGLDPGVTLGQRFNKNHNLYRSSGDIVSALGSTNKNIETIKGKQSLITGTVRSVLDAHGIDNIKDKNILV
jgi:hypothetical protein